MFSAEVIENCHYLPMSTMRRVMKFIENPITQPDRRCKRNLLHLQTDRNMQDSERREKKWRNRYQIAVCRAIYSHDWNKLLFLLKKSPIWEHKTEKLDEIGIYVKALLILLMNHPSAKAQSLLDNYLHMVISCRSDEDKKAVYKVLFTLPQKLYRR